MTADDILSAARSEIGTPFRHQGRIPGKALDCAGLVVRVAVLLDLPFIEHGGYARRPSNGMLESALDGQPCLDLVSKSSVQAGDVLLMRFASEPQHLAIFTGTNIIHSYQASGKVCEHILDKKWLSRIVAVYRFKGLNNE